MKVKAETTAKIQVDAIGGKGPLKYVIISGRMGEAKPEFTQKLFVGDSLIANLKIDIDTDDNKKWDTLHVER